MGSIIHLQGMAQRPIMGHEGPRLVTGGACHFALGASTANDLVPRKPRLKQSAARVTPSHVLAINTTSLVTPWCLPFQMTKKPHRLSFYTPSMIRFQWMPLSMTLTPSSTKHPLFSWRRLATKSLCCYSTAISHKEKYVFRFLT
jgi:hypothetical protein